MCLYIFNYHVLSSHVQVKCIMSRRIILHLKFKQYLRFFMQVMPIVVFYISAYVLYRFLKYWVLNIPHDDSDTLFNDGIKTIGDSLDFLIKALPSTHGLTNTFLDAIVGIYILIVLIISLLFIIFGSFQVVLSYIIDPLTTLVTFRHGKTMMILFFLLVCLLTFRNFVYTWYRNWGVPSKAEEFLRAQILSEIILNLQVSTSRDIVNCILYYTD
jgi:hypothetical protein